MIYYLKFDIPTICKRLAQEQLKNAGLEYTMLNTNELDINEVVSQEYLDKLNAALSEWGFEIVATHKIILVQKIKQAITELIYMDNNLIFLKTSHYLAKKLNHSYRYLSAIFSEVTYTTIENYIILQKIERAKEMIASGEFTFTEITWKLNYSSAAHFSKQFKNTVGFTPSIFKRVIDQRRAVMNDGINARIA